MRLKPVWALVEGAVAAVRDREERERAQRGRGDVVRDCRAVHLPVRDVAVHLVAGGRDRGRRDRRGLRRGVGRSRRFGESPGRWPPGRRWRRRGMSGPGSGSSRSRRGGSPGPRRRVAGAPGDRVGAGTGTVKRVATDWHHAGHGCPDPAWGARHASAGPPRRPRPPPRRPAPAVRRALVGRPPRRSGFRRRGRLVPRGRDRRGLRHRGRWPGRSGASSSARSWNRTTATAPSTCSSRRTSRARGWNARHPGGRSATSSTSSATTGSPSTRPPQTTGRSGRTGAWGSGRSGGCAGYERGPDGTWHDGLLMDLLRDELR